MSTGSMRNKSVKMDTGATERAVGAVFDNWSHASGSASGPGSRTCQLTAGRLPEAAQLVSKCLGLRGPFAEQIAIDVLVLLSGVRTSLLVEGLPSNRASDLGRGVGHVTDLLSSLHTSARSPLLAVMVLSGNTFVINCKRLDELIAAFSAITSSASASQGGPAGPTASAFAASGIPCAVCIAKELGSPHVLLDSAWLDWCHGMAACLAAVQSAVHQAGAAADGGSATVITGGSTVRPVVGPVHIPDSSLASACPVALAGVLLGYPCVYDTRTPAEIASAARAARGAMAATGPASSDASGAGASTTGRSTAVDARDDDDWSEGRPHCLQGQQLKVHSCVVALSPDNGSTSSTGQASQGPGQAAQGSGPGPLDRVLTRLDFSHPASCHGLTVLTALPGMDSMGSTGLNDSGAGSASMSGAGVHSSAAAAAAGGDFGRWPGSSTAGSASVERGTSGGPAVVAPARTRVTVCAHVGAWKRALTARAAAAGPILLSAPPAAASSASSGASAVSPPLATGQLQVHFSSRTETPDAVAL